MLIRPNELKEGQKSIIKRWVNQSDYIGNTLEMENGELVMTYPSGITTKNIDMRYAHFCIVDSNCI